MKKQNVTLSMAVVALSIGIGALLFPVGLAVAADKPITLKLAVMHGPKAGKYVNGHEPWAKKLEKAANGKVKVEIFPSNSLVTGKECYDATINGLVDIGFIALVHYPGRFPLADVLSIPGATLSNPKVSSRVVWELYNKYPKFQQHFKQVKMLFLFGYAPISIGTVDSPILKLEDLEGLRMRFAGKGGSAFLKSAGATPMAMPPSELFLNLQKGVIKGSGIGWEGQKSFGAIKVCKHYTAAPMIPGPFFAYLMNKRKFDSLPKDVQDAIMSVSGEAGMEHFSDGDMLNDKHAKETILAEGHQIYELSAEEQARWVEQCKSIAAEMIQKIAKKGVPAQAFYDDMVQLATTYQNQ
jgi:TRAP-type C4-dicarboxylate transport system substrate-binding protein